MTVLLPLALSKIGVPVPPEAAVIVAVYTAAIALLLVSRFPTWSGKRVGQRIPTDSVMPFLVMAVLMIALLISYPFSVLAIGGIFYLELASVILQVGYFKWTGGRRVFRCSPIHHHFHLGGWSEQQVVTRFWVLSVVFAMMALVSIKLR